MRGLIAQRVDAQSVWLGLAEVIVVWHFTGCSALLRAGIAWNWWHDMAGSKWT